MIIWIVPTEVAETTEGSCGRKECQEQTQTPSIILVEESKHTKEEKTDSNY